MTDLIGGQMTMFADAPMLPQVTAARCAAWPSPRPSARPPPNMPTVNEALGLKDYDMSYWTAVYLPAGASAAVTNRLNEMLLAATATPASVAFQAATSGEVATTTPDGLAKFQAAESQQVGHGDPRRRHRTRNEPVTQEDRPHRRRLGLLGRQQRRARRSWCGGARSTTWCSTTWPNSPCRSWPPRAARTRSWATRPISSA